MKKEKKSAKTMTFNDFENKYFSKVIAQQNREQEHKRADYGKIIANQVLDALKEQFKTLR